MDNWLTKLTDWLLSLVKKFFQSLVDFAHDSLIWLFDSVLAAISGLLSAIPSPDFMANGGGIGSMLSGLPPFALYVIAQIGLTEFFAILLGGVLFRLTRKLLTLGQW